MSFINAEVINVIISNIPNIIFYFVQIGRAHV